MGQTDGLNDAVGAVAVGEFAQPTVQIFFAGMDELSGTCLSSDFELSVVHVNCDDTSTVKCGRRDCTKPYAAAAEDRDGIVFGNASACCGVEPHR